MSSAAQSFVVDFAEDCKSYLDTPTSNFVASDYRKASSNFVPHDSGDVVSLFESGARSKIKEPCRAGVDTLVLDWYVRLLHPPKSYLEHLDYFREHDRDGNFSDYEAGGHIEGFYFYKHKREEETWVAVPDVVCDPYNPCAKFKSIRSSASRTYSQLRNLKGCDNIVFLDLTFPKEISNLLLGSNQLSVIEKAHRCVARFFELLKPRLQSHINEKKPARAKQQLPAEFLLGYQYNPHLWKTQDPTQPHLHIHLDLLWAYYNEDADKLEPLKFHARGKPASADFVRSLWKQAVSETFNYDYGDKDPDILLKWAPLGWGTKVLHRLKYRRRKPVTDLGEYYLDHDFDPNHFDDGFNEFLLNYVNRSHSHGFWTFLVRLLKDSSSICANVKVCPVCGEKVISEVYIPFEEGVFDRVVIQDRHGSFRSVEPPP